MSNIQLRNSIAKYKKPVSEKKCCKESKGNIVRISLRNQWTKLMKNKLGANILFDDFCLIAILKISTQSKKKKWEIYSKVL